MKTNASAQWIKFVQLGDEFLWDIAVQDIATSVLGTTATLFTLGSVPTGVQVWVLAYALSVNAAAGAAVTINSPDAAVTAANSPSGNTTLYNPVANVATAAGSIRTRTNTSAQIRAVSLIANTTLHVDTFGWLDTRGKDL